METKRPLKQKTIGILGGCSDVATKEYYQMINSLVNNQLGGWEIAETLIVGMNFGNIEAFVRKERPRWFQPSTGGTVISWLDYRRPGCPDG